MVIAMAQINTHLGNLASNGKKIVEHSQKAFEEGADLVVFPELALIGYSPNDLLERPELFEEQNKELYKIAQSIPKDLCALIGCAHKFEGKVYNSCALIKKNKVQKIFHKELLPSYDVFDEPRHFFSGQTKKNFFKHKGQTFLVTICEDLWFSQIEKYTKDPLANLNKKPDHIISLNASPFEIGKQKIREKLISKLSRRLSCPISYVNMVGAQDELIFDGQSFQTDAKGTVITRLKAFKEQLYLSNNSKKAKASIPSKYKAMESALILGIRDYFQKTGFKKAHLGLSGGIDSALVVYLATQALGAENVTAIALPGPYSTSLSFKLAEKLAKNLKINFLSHDFNKTYKSFAKDLERSFGKTSFGLLHENLQARIRALTLMAFSNKENSLLLATSNKSELCVGYSTLYGDQCGALMPIGDVLKSDVFGLCKWINKTHKKEIIPSRIITRPPSAELRPNQKDSDSLPSYEDLDKSIHRMITQRKKPSSKLDKWVLNRSYAFEFKRWQSAPVLKISEHAFGIGRRMPLAHSFRAP